MTLIGRPPIKLDKEQILRLYNSGLSTQQIAPFFGVSWATIIRRLKLWNVPLRYIYPAWNKGLTISTDERVKINSQKTSRFAGHKHTQESRQKMSKAITGKNTWSKGSKKSEETKRRNSEATKHLWQDLKYRANQIQKMKDHWANPEYKTRVRPLLIKGNHTKPSKPEQRLIDIINKAQLPFQYTGDGSFMIQGLNPDFVNCDGAKTIIEVFGNYWHGKHARTWKETELGRIMAFNSFGFRCIILWESEINTLSDAIISERIKNESARLSCLHGARIKRKTGA